MLFYFAELFERWSEWCYARARSRRYRSEQEVSEEYKRIVNIALKARLPEIVANITKSNPLLEKLRGKK